MAKHVVIAHALSWVARDEVAERLHHYSAFRGEEVEIPDHIVERFRQMTEADGLPRVGTREEHDAWVAGPGQPHGVVYPGGVSDDALRQMTAEQVAAHLDTHNVDADRVLRLENERDQPRKTIVAAAEKHLDARNG